MNPEFGEVVIQYTEAKHDVQINDAKFEKP